MADLGPLSNFLADRLMVTVFPCVKCIFYFAQGEWRHAGYLCCSFYTCPLDEVPELDTWHIVTEKGVVVHFRKCYRCFLRHDECLAVPEELYDELMSILPHLEILHNKESTADAKELAQGRLQKICTKMAKALSTKFNPHSEKLERHSGATRSDQNPYSGTRSVGRRRDKVTVAAKSEGTKRAVDQQATEVAATPRKKAKGAVVDEGRRNREAILREFDDKIAALRSSRDAAESRHKGSFTRQITKVNKEKKDFVEKNP